ncbi:hypothetical protein DQ04_09701010, partial [Trypanosoma grayi]|uniref:hypothetical protein n=1 Tax=Trypanosoma grayi TaxID=71804 RepID=UPI0004F4A70B
MTVTVRHVLFVLSLALCCACGCVAAVQQRPPEVSRVTSPAEMPKGTTLDQIKQKTKETKGAIDKAVERATKYLTRAEELIKQTNAALKKNAVASHGEVVGTGRAADAMPDVQQPMNAIKRHVDSMQKDQKEALTSYNSVLSTAQTDTKSLQDAYKHFRNLQGFLANADLRAESARQNVTLVVQAMKKALHKLQTSEASVKLLEEVESLSKTLEPISQATGGGEVAPGQPARPNEDAQNPGNVKGSMDKGAAAGRDVQHTTAGAGVSHAGSSDSPATPGAAAHGSRIDSAKGNPDTNIKHMGQEQQQRTENDSAADAETPDSTGSHSVVGSSEKSEVDSHVPSNVAEGDTVKHLSESKAGNHLIDSNTIS